MILISPGLDQGNKNPKREVLPERCQWGSDKLSTDKQRGDIICQGGFINTTLVYTALELGLPVTLMAGPLRRLLLQGRKTDTLHLHEVPGFLVTVAVMRLLTWACGLPLRCSELEWWERREG